MNKTLQNMTKKWKLISFLCAFIILAGVVVCAIFGFHVAPTAGDVNTLTVRLESYASDEVVATIDDICEDALHNEGLSYKYSSDVEFASGKVHEYVYVFEKNVSLDELNEVKTAIDSVFASEKANEESVLYKAFVYVSVSEGKVVATLTGDFLWRVILAGVVFLVAAFTYSAIRHGVKVGALTVASTVFAVALQFALVVLIRIPVTATVGYAFAFTALLTASLVSLYTGNVKRIAKLPDNESKSLEELTLEGVDVKNVGIFACGVLVALILVGAIAVTPVAWLAVSALAGLVCSSLVYFALLPGAFLSLKKCEKATAEKKAKYNYKKESK